MYVHSPLPAPNDEAAASLKVMGEIWSLDGPSHARVYACPDSSHLVFKVFTWSEDDDLVCNWYIQPNIQIRDSLAYIFNVEPTTIVPLDISIMKEFATHCNIEPDPL